MILLSMMLDPGFVIGLIAIGVTIIGGIIAVWRKHESDVRSLRSDLEKESQKNEIIMDNITQDLEEIKIDRKEEKREQKEVNEKVLSLLNNITIELGVLKEQIKNIIK